MNRNIQPYEDEDYEIIEVSDETVEPYGERPIANNNSFSIVTVVSILALIISGVSVFAPVPQLAYLLSFAVHIVGSAIVGWWIYGLSNNKTIGILTGCLVEAIVLATNISANIYDNSYLLVYSFQSVARSVIAVVGLVAFFIVALRSRQ